MHQCVQRADITHGLGVGERCGRVRRILRLSFWARMGPQEISKMRRATMTLIVFGRLLQRFGLRSLDHFHLTARGEYPRYRLLHEWVRHDRGTRRHGT